MKSALDTLKDALHHNTQGLEDLVHKLSDAEEEVGKLKYKIKAYESSIEDIQKAIKIMEAVQ